MCCVDTTTLCLCLGITFYRVPENPKGLVSFPHEWPSNPSKLSRSKPSDAVQTLCFCSKLLPPYRQPHYALLNRARRCSTHNSPSAPRASKMSAGRVTRSLLYRYLLGAQDRGTIQNPTSVSNEEIHFDGMDITASKRGWPA